jgi:hypothetical protein
MRYYLGAAVAAILLAGPAAAAVTVSTSASGTGNNVVFASCSSATVGAGELVGCLNGEPDTLLRFASTGDSLFSPSGGQARIEADDGAFDDLTIDFLDDGSFFDALVLNIIALSDGTVTFDGQTFDLSENGSNFFTLTFDTAVNLFSFTTSADVIADVRQLRIRGAEGPGPDPVPEPAAISLLGLAVAGLGFARRRRA